MAADRVVRWSTAFAAVGVAAVAAVASYEHACDLVWSHGESGSQLANGELRGQAWQWALADGDEDRTLPSGGAIARDHGHQEWWGRLVKNAGLAGTFGPENAQPPAPWRG